MDRQQQKAMFAKKYGTTGNKVKNPYIMLRDFDESHDFVKEHVEGRAGNGVRSGHWREVHRQEAVKMANRIKKVSGEYPVGFDFIQTVPKSYEGDSGSALSTIKPAERKKGFTGKYNEGDDIEKYTNAKWDSETYSGFWTHQIVSIAKQLKPEQRVKFLNAGKAKQKNFIGHLANLPDAKWKIGEPS